MGKLCHMSDESINETGVDWMQGQVVYFLSDPASSKRRWILGHCVSPSIFALAVGTNIELAEQQSTEA